MERKSAPWFLRRKALHINQTHVPTVVCIGIVVGGVILLKAFVGYTNVCYKWAKFVGLKFANR